MSPGYLSRLVYQLLLRSSAATLLELGRDTERLGGELGVTTVLHTWTQKLELHPHAHCIVTGAALSEDGSRWIESRSDYLFPVKASNPPDVSSSSPSPGPTPLDPKAATPSGQLIHSPLALAAAPPTAPPNPPIAELRRLVALRRLRPTGRRRRTPAIALLFM